jgi:DNA-directed RNA polymerase specialized sigma24 family protein
MRQQLAQLGGGAHALAIRILGNPDDAADAVHEAFATVLAKPQAFDD